MTFGSLFAGIGGFDLGLERAGMTSDVVRSRHELPDWMDRIKSLGNAVCPEVAYWIGSRIMEAEKRA